MSENAPAERTLEEKKERNLRNDILLLNRHVKNSIMEGFSSVAMSRWKCRDISNTPDVVVMAWYQYFFQGGQESFNKWIAKMNEYLEIMQSKVRLIHENDKYRLDKSVLTPPPDGYPDYVFIILDKQGAPYLFCVISANMIVARSYPVHRHNAAAKNTNTHK